MSKKDYILIAQVLQDAMTAAVGNQEYGEDRPIVIAVLANKLADAFGRENPRFDRFRFLAACGGK